MAQTECSVTQLQSIYTYIMLEAVFRDKSAKIDLLVNTKFSVNRNRNSSYMHMAMVGSLRDFQQQLYIHTSIVIGYLKWSVSSLEGFYIV